MDGGMVLPQLLPSVALDSRQSVARMTAGVSSYFNFKVNILAQLIYSLSSESALSLRAFCLWKIEGKPNYVRP